MACKALAFGQPTSRHTKNSYQALARLACYWLALQDKPRGSRAQVHLVGHELACQTGLKALPPVASWNLNWKLIVNEALQPPAAGRIKFLMKPCGKNISQLCPIHRLGEQQVASRCLNRLGREKRSNNFTCCSRAAKRKQASAGSCCCCCCFLGYSNLPSSPLSAEPSVWALAALYH